MKKYYVRVSTAEQKTDRQLVAFQGADMTFIDKLSGKDTNRPQLQAMLESLQEGDVVVCKSLDRLSRSTLDLLNIAKAIEQAGAFLQVLDKDIDTSTPIGKFFLTVIGAVAELERANIRQRTREGIEVAKTKGKYTGRKAGSIALTQDATKRFVAMYKGGMNKSSLAKEFGVTRATVYSWIRVLQERGEL